MNYLRELIVALLVEGKPAIADAQVKGVTSDLFAGSDGAALSFVYKYFRDYNAIPSLELVNKTAGYSPEDALQGPPKAAAGFFVDKLVQARMSVMLGVGAEKLSQALEQRDPEAAITTLQDTLKELRAVRSDRARVVSLPKVFSQVIDLHDRRMAGERGVMTPWGTMNEATFGFGATDFVLFVARLGVGKTWTLLILALHAWMTGKRVLIASTEMDQLRMALRAMALHFKLPPDMLRKGTLGQARNGIAARIKEVEDLPGLYMVGGGNYRLGFDSVEAAAEEVEPNVILLDGAYLLVPAANKEKSKGAGRFDKAAETFEECKQFNMRIKVPVIATTQFNRQARRNSLAGAEVENIALSDTAGWAADYIFALLQTDEMKDAREAIIKPLKTREGSMSEFMIRWDIDGGDFQEIPHTRREGATGTGSGVGSAPAFGSANPFTSKPMPPGQPGPVPHAKDDGKGDGHNF